MTHRGQIVEKVVRESGYSITKLAQKLTISRNTLYNRFDNPNLGYGFIVQVGNIIFYDFTVDFPEMKKQANLELTEKDKFSMLWRAEMKYTNLLEKHNKLLSILVRIAHGNEWSQLKHEVIALMKESE